MEIKRFFVDSSAITNNNVILTGVTYKHLGLVLRAKVGYKVIICCNDGIEHLCIINAIDSNSIILEIESSKKIDKKQHVTTLYASILKNSKLDYVIQKAVELGVSNFVPFISKRTVETKFNIERARTIALESAQQCGSSFLTNINEPIIFDEVLKDASKNDISFIAYECEKKTSFASIKDFGYNIGMIVGPEGGFEVEEIVQAQKEGIIPITLGKRILRADTASIVISTLLLDKIGELEYAQ